MRNLLAIIISLAFIGLMIAVFVRYFPCGSVGSEGTCDIIPWCESEDIRVTQTDASEPYTGPDWSCENTWRE